jgi:peptidyl-prolyl cis-trans isomerase C
MASPLRPAANRGFFPRFSPFAALILLLLPLAGCHQVVKDPKDPKFIVAESKDWTITRAQLNDEITNFLKERQKTIADVDPAKEPMLETEVLNTMVIKKLLLARAGVLNLPDVDKDDDATFAQLKGHFPSDAEFQAQLKTAGLTQDDLKRQIHEGDLIRKTLEIEAFHDLQPSDAEINAFYLQNKDKLTTPDKIRASRIIVMADDQTTPAVRAAKKKAIDKAHARVVKGEDFSKVATEVSEDRYSAPKGGDIGYFQRGENEAHFDEVAFATKPGAVSPVFVTPMGFEFLKVTDVHPGGVVSIAQARDTISKYLLQQKRKAAMDVYAKKLLATSDVTFHLVRVNPDQLPSGAPGADASTNGAPQ